jgi:hypothetical protein
VSLWLVLAFVIEALVFFTYALIDVKVIMSQESFWGAMRSVWWAFPFIAVSPLAVWWAYRTVYRAVNSQIWVAMLISSFVAYCAVLAGNFVGSQQIPSRNQAIALVLKGIALVVANL